MTLSGSQGANRAHRCRSAHVTISTRFLRYLFPIVAPFFICGCSVGFVSQSAYNYLGVLWRSEAITKVLAEKRLDEETRIKLALILEAREFAKRIGLNVGENYSTYAEVPSEALAWIVTASRRNRFEPYTWWYPVVGTLPYKGYFLRSDAEMLSKELLTEGYETSIRDTVAFSTLGWFSDPVLSSIVKLPREQVIQTILHELLHATVWIPNQVEFNESLANFVGIAAAQEFFEAQHDPALEELAANSLDENLRYSDYVQEIRVKLESLYNEDHGEDLVLVKRDELLGEINRANTEKIPTRRSFKRVNNATIMGVSMYFSQLREFKARFDALGGSWPDFFDCMKTIAEEYNKAPYDALVNATLCEQKNVSVSSKES